MPKNSFRSMIWKRSRRTYHADSVLVRRGGRAYIAVALSNDRKGQRWLGGDAVPLDPIALDQGAHFTDVENTGLMKNDAPIFGQNIGRRRQAHITKSLGDVTV